MVLMFAAPMNVVPDPFMKIVKDSTDDSRKYQHLISKVPVAS